MNYIDLIIAIILLFGAYRGYSKGLLLSIATLTGLIFGIIMSMKYSANLNPWVIDFFGVQAQYATYLSMSIIFFAVLILLWILGKMLTSLANAISLNFVNKIMGMVFGVIKYGLAIGVIILIFNAVDSSYHIVSPETKSESFFYNKLLKGTTNIYNNLNIDKIKLP